MPSGGLGFRAYSFFDTLLWIACLNIFWITFTLLGGVLLGVGPSTAAAHILVRDRVRGNAAPLLKRFAREYFKNFLKGNLLGVPVLLVVVALFLNWSYFSAGWDLGSQVASMAVLLLVLFAAGALCHLFPMFARYELTIPLYFLMSSRFAMRHLAGTAILLFMTAAAAFACRQVPGLIPFFGVGAWLYVTGWLCDRFFSANDDAVAQGSAAADGAAEVLASPAASGAASRATAARPALAATATTVPASKGASLA
ncbi:YesL family protein [Paenarthrobacter ureafaciens]|uniref:YesL family protein n=1 Tax=Paenarthrobacter ureafaciens TaxID=37931 RepID=UPI00140D6E1D|nr:DUF624 domain-containing protein [Paenarthrobacter ureafaciens]MCX8456490.1 DUF624 domain-containing protein [Paenarthrobacter ureafaciens]MCY0972549.1 DUF624 domain-containing protein [Paenarthrobacter ureafaciens]